MNKLISLLEKPATKDDVGKTAYDARNKVYKIIGFSNNLGIETLSGFFNAENPYLYWQKPVLISEDEYNSLKRKVYELQAENDRLNSRLV